MTRRKTALVPTITQLPVPGPGCEAGKDPRRRPTAEPQRLDSLRFLLRDPDSKYSPAVDPVFQAEEMDIFKARPGTPDERAPRAITTTRRTAMCHRVLITRPGPSVTVL
jgi:hypothetical protein